MRLVLLTALVIFAFAANSILNRVGVASGGVSAEGFAAIRVLAGAVVLAVLVLMHGGRLAARPSALGVLGLTAYLIGFSQAYIALDAGLGALILFGGVQVTMFAGALILGEHVPRQRWIGMGVAMAGLVWLTGGVAADGSSQLALVMMSLAALGWGVYSMVGRGVADPLATTARNFIWSVPLVAAPLALSGTGTITGFGVAVAVLSGAVTSGLGYALWYSVLPRLEASVAAVSQLTVPVIAIVAGAVLLGEALSWNLIMASIIVLGGVALSLWR